MRGYNYSPIIKHRGFDPSPVAGKIPLFADSINNPKSIYTKNYEEFWLEQVDRCKNGYHTGGVFIPGRYYYYLNFVPIRGLIKGRQYPWYVDIDQEFFTLVDFVKERKKPGVIIPKARRKGLSEKGKSILSHGVRFVENYRGAITAGLETYVNGLRNKFEDVENNIVSDLTLNQLKNNDKAIQFGYEIKNDLGSYIEDGYGGMISFETMYDDPLKLEGEYFHDVICEESGRYKLLGRVIESIKPALQFGSQMLGTFFIYGTGGNILSTSKDFKEYWDEAENLGFERMWVPGNRLYYPFLGNPVSTEPFKDEITGIEVDPIKNLRQYEPYQIIGCEDTVAAKEHILNTRIAYAKLKNKKKLKEHNQNLPLEIDEAFSSGGSNNFDDELVYEQLFNLQGDPNAYKEVILEWVTRKADDGSIERTGNVVARPATKNDPEWKIIKVYQEPVKDLIDLDVAGIDSYNQDQTQTTSSLGAMVVLRQGNRVNLQDRGIHDAEYPVCLYYRRPPRKEQFYEICLMISTWYKLLRNTMCSAEQDFVIDYYKKNNGIKYLSPRPKSFDTKGSKQMHQYGAKMTSSSKPIILGIVQSWILDYVQYCQYVEMLKDFLAYDEEYIGTDWDSTDALALAKMRVEDMRTRPRRRQDDSEDQDRIEWFQDSEGNILIKESSLPTGKKPKDIPENKEFRDNWVSMNHVDRKEKDDDVDF